MTNVFITAESAPHPAKVGQQGRRTVFAEITLLPSQKRDWQSMLFHTDSELVNTLACVSKKNTKNNLQLSMIFTVISLLHLPVMKITCFRLLHSTPAPLRREKDQQSHCCSSSETVPWHGRHQHCSQVLPGLLPSMESESILICLASHLLQKHNKRNKLKCFEEFWRKGYQPSCLRAAVWGALYHKPFCRNKSTALNSLVSMSGHVLLYCQGFHPGTLKKIIKLVQK